MTRGRWITPDEIPENTICRVLYIPDQIEILASVNGALAELIYARNWEQVGAVTPSEMANSMATMFFAYAESECQAMAVPDYFYDEVATNQNGGGITANTLTDVFFATAGDFNPAFVTLNGANFVVSPGLYEYDIWHVIRGDAACTVKCILLNDDTSNVEQVGDTMRCVATQHGIVRVAGVVNVEAETEYVYQIISTDTFATSAFGVPLNASGLVEVYGAAVWRRLGEAS